MSVEGWGWNLLTLQIVISGSVGLLTLFTLLFVYISTRTVQKETTLRTRPWLGVVGCSYQENTDLNMDGLIKDTLIIEYKNIGSLPAADLAIKVSMNAGKIERGGFDLVIGTVFPNEPGHINYENVLLPAWRNAGDDVEFEGEFTYRFGETLYSTKFKGLIKMPAGTIVDWKNAEAT